MAGARTPGIGKGVNWGAFGSMGQQYAQIGRTIESGGSALGQGLGGGLAAIGGAIERKKVRDQQRAEREQARADEQSRFDITRQDRLAENATDNAFRERQLGLQNEWRVYEDQQQQARWMEQKDQAEKQFRVGALNTLADNDRMIVQAAEQGLVDPAMGAQAAQRLQSSQTALGSMLGIQGGGQGGLDPNTSSAIERPDQDVLSQQMAMKRVQMLKNSPLGRMLTMLPPEQAAVAEAGISLQLSRQKRAEAETITGRTPKDLLKRKALEREAIIYESKAAPALAAQRQRGMARKQEAEQAKTGMAIEDQQMQREKHAMAVEDQQIQKQKLEMEKADRAAKLQEADARVAGEIVKQHPQHVTDKLGEVADLSVLSEPALRGFLERNPNHPQAPLVRKYLETWHGSAQSTPAPAAAPANAGSWAKGPDGIWRKVK